MFNQQGEWKPKMIDNPAYKGEWIHPEIDNPDYAADPELYKYDDIGAIGFDLWQVQYMLHSELYLYIYIYHKFSSHPALLFYSCRLNLAQFLTMFLLLTL